MKSILNKLAKKLSLDCETVKNAETSTVEHFEKLKNENEELEKEQKRLKRFILLTDDQVAEIYKSNDKCKSSGG